MSISRSFIAIALFIIGSLSIFGTVAAQEVTTSSGTLSDSELFQLIQDIEAATPDERVFPDISTVADISELDADDRAGIAYDAADWQENIARQEAMAGFEMPAQCFDFYRFGSVRAPISIERGHVASGTETEFTVTLTNENPYPVVDANVYVKIFREREAGEESAQLAHVVDQFQAVSDITLGADETKSYSFTYQVPASLPTGTYRIASFVSVDERFNLHGLPFTDDVLGDTLSFSVTGESDDMVRWERDRVRINGEQHYFASFIPEVSETDPVRISAPVHNGRDTAVNADITWTVYHWDQQREANQVSVETDRVSLAPGDTVPVTYTLTNTDHAVYVVVGEVSYGDATSIINVRLARENVPEIRLNYPGVVSYPLIAGEANGVFSCLHSASSFSLISDGRLDISLSDAKGNEFYQYSYEGPVSADMMGVAEGFRPDRSYDTFTLHAALYQGDTLVEESTFTYDCEELTDGPCAKEEPMTLMDKVASSPTYLLGVTTLAVLLLVLFGYLLRRHYRASEQILSLFLVALVGGVMVGAMAPTPQTPIALAQFEEIEIAPVYTEADSDSKSLLTGTGSSITASDTYVNNLSRLNNASSSRVNNALQAPHATVRYYADIINTTTDSRMSDGDVVHVGDVIQFSPRRGEIEWFGTGQYTDSPLGVWYQNAVFPQGVLTDFRFTDGLHADYDSAPYAPFRVNSSVSIPFSVHPAPTAVTVTGTARLVQMGGNRYEVVSPGTIEATYTYDATYGYYYFGRLVGTRVDYPGINPMMTQDTLTNYRARFGPRALVRNVTAEAAAPAGNQAPANTVIDGPTEGITGTSYEFNVTGTDPDGDDVYYEVDWTGHGVVTARMPNTGTVASGETRTASRAWSTPGEKTFYARTTDQYGTQSAWVSHTITIADPASISVSLEAQVDDGVWSASDRTVEDTSVVRLRWTSTAAVDCYSGTIPTGGATNNLTGVVVTTPPSGTAQDYEIGCDGPGGSVSDYLRITVSDSPLPTVLVETRVDGGAYSADEKVVDRDQQVDLRWESTNTVMCDGGTNLPGVTGTSGTITNVTLPTPGNTLTYDVYCENSTGDGTNDAVEVTVPTTDPAATDPVTADLNVSINDSVPVTGTRQVSEDDDVVLRWDSTNADRCEGTNFNTSNATANSVGVPVTVATDSVETYTVTCTRDADGASDSATVTLYAPDDTLTGTGDPSDPSGDPPILTASPSIVRNGGDSSVQWDLQGNTNCTYIDQAGDIQTASEPTGSILLEGLTSLTVFRLTCASGAEESVSINVLPVISET